MRIFVCGYPGDIGGANTELWHTVKLWRRFGAEVTLIPTWKADAVWRGRLDGIGCRTIESNPDNLQNVAGLAGGIVVSMCNSRFLAVAERFAELRCKIVWLGCMNHLLPDERRHYRLHGAFDRYVFQSRYQRDELLQQLAKYGCDAQRVRIIRGAFDIEEFPFRPLRHRMGETFVIGRLSRAAADKYSPRTWAIYGRVPDGRIAARVMGWDASVQARLGPPPPWARCLPPGAETPQVFLSQVHCLAQTSGGAVENWPRVGLEAMAAGVPVIAENAGGWPEMIRHCQTGFLCDNEEDMAACIGGLAHDPKRRCEIIDRARQTVETELADPELFWSEWKLLLEELA